MATVDALSLLRQFVLRGEVAQVALHGDLLHFGGDRACARGSPSSFRATDTSFYPIDAVWFSFQTRAQDTAVYLQQCRQRGMMPVRFAHRKELVNYLTGEIATSALVETAHPPATEWIYPTTTASTVAATATATTATTATATAASVAATAAGAVSARKRPLEATAAEGEAVSSADSKRALLSEDAREKTPGKSPVMISSVDPRTQDILNRERVTRDDKNVLLSDSLIFSSVIRTIMDLESASRHASPSAKSQSAGHRSSKTGANGSSALRGAHASSAAADRRHGGSSSGSSSKDHHAKQMTPIILVPAAPSSLIGLYNIKDFLEDKSYVTPQRAKESGSKKLTSVTIQRKSSEGKDQTYEVVDTVAQLKSEDWNRVVAVFVTGAAWQFKDFKWQDPATLFSKVRGFHLAFDDVAVDANVAKWNVTVLQINQTKRHLDTTAVMHFWNELDQMLSRSANSRFSSSTNTTAKGR